MSIPLSDLPSVSSDSGNTNYSISYITTWPRNSNYVAVAMHHEDRGRM